MHKLDALTRILEAEPFDAMIVFARTKQATEELAEKLQARGFAAAAINGDIAQAQRERTIQQLKDGKLDILVATDVAARGLDVERISHVVNYDMPHDTECYVHRIGRTGRAGRSGEAILFVTPREKRMLQIDRARHPPADRRDEAADGRGRQRPAHRQVQAAHQRHAGPGDLELFQQLIEQYEQEHNIPAIEIAAALARIAQGGQPLLLAPPPKREHAPREHTREHTRDAGSHDRGEREHRPRDRDRDSGPREFVTRPVRPHHTEEGKRTYRVEVGHEHGVKPGNIIGAIANEAGLESGFIGRLSIRGEYSLIDLPDGMPAEVFKHLQKVWVSQQQLRIKEWDGNDTGAEEAAPRRPGGGYRPGGFKKPGGGGGKPRPQGHGGGKPPRRK